MQPRPPGVCRSSATALFALLTAGNAGAWLWAWLAFGERPALLGTALLAYVFGMRHAFDADHIAAIDNVVRKLIQEGRPAAPVGFFFSLGHSTIVVLATVALVGATALVQRQIEGVREIGGLIGTIVSAVFLTAIGLLNLLILRRIWSSFRRARLGFRVTEEELDALLTGRGLLARLFRPLFHAVGRPWHMFLIGFLFALGFDTATEIGVLGISATQAANGMPLWTILVFPSLFTAGMSLMDTADSVLMVRAYGWAFVSPVRKLWYNLTITAASVVVALFIGGVEALGLIAGRLGLEGRVWQVIAGLNDNLADFGFAVAGIFLATWLLSAAIYRARGYDRIGVE